MREEHDTDEKCDFRNLHISRKAQGPRVTLVCRMSSFLGWSLVHDLCIGVGGWTESY